MKRKVLFANFFLFIFHFFCNLADFRKQRNVADPIIFCDFATDVYSYGVIVWSMLTGKLPYAGLKAMDMILMIKNAERLQISNEEWKMWLQCSDLNIKIAELKLLLNSCWAQYPQKRPTFKELVMVLEAMAKKMRIDSCVVNESKTMSLFSSFASAGSSYSSLKN